MGFNWFRNSGVNGFVIFSCVFFLNFPFFFFYFSAYLGNGLNRMESKMIDSCSSIWDCRSIELIKKRKNADLSASWWSSKSSRRTQRHRLDGRGDDEKSCVFFSFLSFCRRLPLAPLLPPHHVRPAVSMIKHLPPVTLFAAL